MHRRIIVLSILCVVLAFTLAVTTVSPAVLAETTSSSVTKKSNDEQPYEDPTTKPTEPTTKPTEPTTKPTEPSSKPTESSSSSTEPSSKPTESSSSTEPSSKPTESSSSTDPTGSTSSTDPNSSTSSTNKSDNTSTTKKKTTGKTTTRTYYPTQPRPTVSKVDMPVVENTTQEGTEVLNPMDAYFERISGNSTEFAPIETTTESQPEEPQKKLSTAAIVAICLIGFALVVVALTAVFAIRNKRANTEDDAPYAGGSYDADDDIYADPAPQPTESTDDDAFTVVSLDDKNYKD